jgi:hypothetical protein
MVGNRQQQGNMEQFAGSSWPDLSGSDGEFVDQFPIDVFLAIKPHECGHYELMALS